PVQYGHGINGLTNPVTGQLASGDVTLDEATLAANRIDYGELIRTHVLDDDTTRERAAELDKVTVPLLSAANWGGQGLHLRGNVEGFLRAASTQKWLEGHGRGHWGGCYPDHGGGLARGVLHRRRGGAAAAVLRPFFARQGQWLGRTTGTAAECPACRRHVHPPRRAELATAEHPLHQVVPRQRH